jgi:GTP-binding protein LepA
MLPRVTDGGQADSPGVWGPVGLGDYSGASMSYPLERIRNFAIIAHVDHGKSTLADRMLQLTKLVEGRQMRAQYLDKMDLERERGITIKAQAVRMPFQAADGSEYLLNLIDTPGHVDFSYEVSRAMNACEGAVLLVDAAQGIEAQTIANLYVAIEAGLEVIPVLNKIDLPAARPEQVAQEIASLLGGDPEDIIAVSAKTGENVPAVLERIVERVPAPKGDPDGPLRALIFDSVYDSYRGVLAYVRVVDGVLRPDQDIRLMATGFHNEVDELAVISPEPKPVDALGPGEVGYLTAAIKEVDQARVGDTVTDHGNPTPEPLPGYREPTPMVYSGMYPVDSDDFPDLRDALEKLRLNDASFTFEPETSVALGFGFRCGFLGLLHMEIISERLSREFDIPLVATAPNVAYEVHLDDKLRKPNEEPVIRVSNPAEMPPPNEIDHVLEPVVEAMILCPSEYIGAVMQLCEKRRGVMGRMEYLTEERVELRYTLPLAEIIFDFFDRLKSATRGYASLDYEPAGMRRSELAKVDILLHGEPVDAFSAVVHREKAYDYGKGMVNRLRELIPRQQFDVPIQAAIGSKIIARETVKAFRKDVTAGLYGGDVTRKRKLLEKQRTGKKRMKSVGSVEIPQEAFIAALSVGDS